jgi:hypothetical protein
MHYYDGSSGRGGLPGNQKKGEDGTDLINSQMSKGAFRLES